MSCELCSLDAAFYGQPLRIFERMRICLGCYLDIHKSGYGAPTYREISGRFIRFEPEPERQAEVA